MIGHKTASYQFFTDVWRPTGIIREFKLEKPTLTLSNIEDSWITPIGRRKIDEIPHERHIVIKPYLSRASPLAVSTVLRTTSLYEKPIRSQPIVTSSGKFSGLDDVIKYANYQNDRSRGSRPAVPAIGMFP